MEGVHGITDKCREWMGK